MRHLLRQLTSRRFLEFALGGGSIALVGFGLLFVLVHYGEWKEWTAFTFQLVVTLVLNFAFNQIITWRDRPGKDLVRRMYTFFVTRSLTVGGSWILFVLLMAWDFQYLVANGICLAASTLVNFKTSDSFVFRLTPATLQPGRK